MTSLYVWRLWWLLQSFLATEGSGVFVTSCQQHDTEQHRGPAPCGFMYNLFCVVFWNSCYWEDLIHFQPLAGCHVHHGFVFFHIMHHKVNSTQLFKYPASWLAWENCVSDWFQSVLYDKGSVSSIRPVSYQNLRLRLPTSRHIQDPASQRLTWNKPPKSVLVIKKIRDAGLLQPFKDLCTFLTEVGPSAEPPWVLSLYHRPRMQGCVSGM